MNLDEYEAFVVFSSLATHPLLLPIYLLDEKTVRHRSYLGCEMVQHF